MARGGESSWTRPFRSRGGSQSSSKEPGDIVNPKSAGGGGPAAAAAAAAGADAEAAAAAGAAARGSATAAGAGGEGRGGGRGGGGGGGDKSKKNKQQQQQASLESPVAGTPVEWSAVMTEQQRRFGIKVRQRPCSGQGKVRKGTHSRCLCGSAPCTPACLPVCGRQPDQFRLSFIRVERTMRELHLTCLVFWGCFLFSCFAIIWLCTGNRVRH